MMARPILSLGAPELQMDDRLIQILKQTDHSELGVPELQMDDFLIRILKETDHFEPGGPRAPNEQFSNQIP